MGMKKQLKKASAAAVVTIVLAGTVITVPVFAYGVVTPQHASQEVQRRVAWQAQLAQRVASGKITQEQANKMTEHRMHAHKRMGGFRAMRDGFGLRGKKQSS